MSKIIYTVVLGFTLFTASTLIAAPTGHYRWTDENGSIKYSDRPPDGIESEFIRFASSKPKTASNDNTAVQKTPQAAAEKPLEIEVLPEKDPALCKQAQSNLKALNGARIRITEPDGSKRLLGEEEKEDQKENARKFIKIHC